MFFQKDNSRSFTLIELLIIISIIGILASLIFNAAVKIRNLAYYSRAKAEMSQIAKALELYFIDNNYNYPADVDRALPNGLEQYLTSNPNWPEAPFPGSVYDWDYWSPNPESSGCKNPSEAPSCQPSGYYAGYLSEEPFANTYQISVRFCPLGDPSGCNFPAEKWAEGFDYYSSAYWCLEGPCRAHGSEDYGHPGCCIGGNCPADQRICR